MLDSAILARILEEPDNDTHRLIAADWFTENGELERGEFVRVQCELARLKCDCQTRAIRGFCDHCRLRRHERKLYQSLILDEVDVPFPVHPDNKYCVWRRGFLHTIRCSAAEWQRLIPADFVWGQMAAIGDTQPRTIGQQVLSQHPVERVEFTDCGTGLTVRAIDLPPAKWELSLCRVHCGDADHFVPMYITRNEMIEAMPTALRAWGVGESVWSQIHSRPYTFREYIDGVEVTVDRPLYARQNPVN